MSTPYTILTPVKENDLRLTFGYTERVNDIHDPVKLFGSTIKQFHKLAIGPYFWFIANPIKWRSEAVGGSFEELTGIKREDFELKSPEVLFRNSHPDDIVKMFAFSTYWINYFNDLPAERKPYVTSTIYMRLLNADKIYTWFMVQYADCIMDEEGKILYGLTLVTNISHIKKEGTAMMSILDTYNESCQQFICNDGKNIEGNQLPSAKLTQREIEVLRLLAKGNSSKQIASVLDISIKTTDNHRQNMLRKTNSKSTGELVSYGVTMGYI